MNHSHRPKPRRRERLSAAQRLQVLAEFERSGLSAAAFARQQGIGYSTLCAWRQRQSKAEPTHGFLEVEVGAPSTPGELWIELGPPVRLRLTSAAPIAWAAQLLHHLNALVAC
jgi:transposase-like protein